MFISRSEFSPVIAVIGLGWGGEGKFWEKYSLITSYFKIWKESKYS